MAVVGLSLGLFILAGCGGPEESASPGEQASERAEDLGFETGVDPALADAAAGDCMDAYSVAATYDTAKLVDCSSPDAFFEISSVGASCPEGDYADVVTENGAHVCGRINVDPEDGCTTTAPCETDTVTVVGVGTMADPTCGMDPSQFESYYEYPADDIVLCFTF